MAALPHHICEGLLADPFTEYVVTVLWLQVCDGLLADPVNIAAMSGALRYICIGLRAELERIRQGTAHSFPVALQSAPQKPYYEASVEHLSELSSAIDHRGPPLLTPYSKEEPQVCLIPPVHAWDEQKQTPVGNLHTGA